MSTPQAVVTQEISSKRGSRARCMPHKRGYRSIESLIRRKEKELEQLRQAAREAERKPSPRVTRVTRIVPPWRVNLRRRSPQERRRSRSPLPRHRRSERATVEREVTPPRQQDRRRSGENNRTDRREREAKRPDKGVDRERVKERPKDRREDDKPTNPGTGSGDRHHPAGTEDVQRTAPAEDRTDGDGASSYSYYSDEDGDAGLQMGA